jgi:hypothetical protein
MSTYTDIRYDYNLPSGFGGSLNLISEQTASGSASISFTSEIDSTYRTYIFKYINIHPSSDASQFEFNLSSDGGSNYNVTKQSSYFIAYNLESGGSGFEYLGSKDLANSTSVQPLIRYMGNGSDEAGSGYLHLYNPSSTTFVKHFIASGNMYRADDGTETNLVGGYGNTTSAINAIQFSISTGTFDGTIKMYGIA